MDTTTSDITTSEITTSDTTTSEATTSDEAMNPMSGMDPEMAAHPQPVFKLLRDESPVLTIEGPTGTGVVLSRREEIDHALRHPEIFSSNMDAVDLKNKRPMIPLQIDPPDHKKFRKLLDPIFAPRKMALLDDEVSTLVNDLIDRFVDRGEVDFAQEFSVPFPSQVFLTLLGLPLEELDRFLVMKDGIIRPDHVTGRPYGSSAAHEYQKKTADSVYEYFDEVLDERDARAPRRPPVALPRRRGRRRPPHPRGHPRHLLPLPDRRARHGDRHARLHVRLPGPASRAAPATRRTTPRSSPPPSRSSCAGRRRSWASPGWPSRRPSSAGCPVHAGDQVMIMLGSANTDEAEFPDADVVRFDREVNRHIAFGGGIHRCLGSHLARLELRVALREWHRRIPEYEVEPEHTLVYTPAIRSIEHFPMRFTAAT